MIASIVVVVILGLLTVGAGLRLLVPLKQPRRQPATFLASLFATLALLLAVDPVYLIADRLLGSVNVTELVKYTLLLLASYYLARAVLAVVEQFTARLHRLLLAALTLSAAVQTAAFLIIGIHPSTVEFTQRYSDRLPTLVFSGSHFVFFGFAEAIAVAVAIAVTRRAGRSLGQVWLIALAIGGCASLINVAVVSARDIARYTGDLAEAATLDAIYRILILTIAIASWVGLGLPAYAGSRRRLADARLLKSLNDELDRIEYSSPYVHDESSEDELSLLRHATLSLRDAQSKGIPLNAHVLALLENAEARLSK